MKSSKYEVKTSLLGEYLSKEERDEIRLNGYMPANAIYRVFEDTANDYINKKISANKLYNLCLLLYLHSPLEEDLSKSFENCLKSLSELAYYSPQKIPNSKVTLLLDRGLRIISKL